MIYRTLYRNLKIEQHKHHLKQGVNRGAPEWYAPLSLSPFVCFIDVLCIDIHVAYWCLTRFSFHMMFVSFNSTRQISLVERTILFDLQIIITPLVSSNSSSSPPFD
jgi:hypothetical protein